MSATHPRTLAVEVVCCGEGHGAVAASIVESWEENNEPGPATGSAPFAAAARAPIAQRRSARLIVTNFHNEAPDCDEITWETPAGMAEATWMNNTTIRTTISEHSGSHV